MGSTIGHKIDYNVVGGSERPAAYPAKINPSNPLGGAAVSLKS